MKSSPWRRIMESFADRTVILADGDFPSSPLARDTLERARRVVCCDNAAAAYFGRTGRAPDAIVGDMDSLDAGTAAKWRDRIEEIAEQDDNDLAKAFRLCVGRGWRDIAILGATGRREDHTLGNISWLAEFAAQAPAVAMVTDNGVFTPMLPPGGTVQTRPGMQLSFFGFDPRQPLSADGVKFPVRDLALRRWFTATLNEATGDRVTLSFGGGPVIVFRATASLV